MKITIVDYGSGNLRSVAKAFERASLGLDRSVEVCVSSEAGDVTAADRVVLPGVGAFGDCRQGIAALPGMEEALRQFVEESARPFLGICVGMQLMAETSEEHGAHEGFGWIAGSVKAIRPSDQALKIPHMGWNNLDFCGSHAVLEGLSDPAPHAYFVHSYAMDVVNSEDLLATTDYGRPLAALVAKDNVLGTQFHPEKSQAFGLALLEGFMRWKP